MAATICVDEKMLDELLAFIEKRGIEIELLTAPDCDVRVVPDEKRTESDLETLYSGGWIACETAQALAGKLGISKRKTGIFLTKIDCRIKRCALGCFG